MGAWDIGSFDNDDAADWLYDLESASDTSFLAATISKVTDVGDEYLEAPDCCMAIAAAEIIAALRGRPLPALPENANEWVRSHFALDTIPLVPAAKAALQRIRTHSELKDLWEEAGDADTEAWHATLNDLSARLSAS